MQSKIIVLDSFLKLILVDEEQVPPGGGGGGSLPLEAVSDTRKSPSLRKVP